MRDLGYTLKTDYQKLYIILQNDFYIHESMLNPCEKELSSCADSCFISSISIFPYVESPLKQYYCNLCFFFKLYVLGAGVCPNICAPCICLVHSEGQMMMLWIDGSVVTDSCKQPYVSWELNPVLWKSSKCPKPWPISLALEFLPSTNFRTNL